MLMRACRIYHESVPEGRTTRPTWRCALVRAHEVRLEPKAHWDIGETCILDFATAGKITGARFTVYRGSAPPERAIINYYLDTHTQNGYTEIFPPYMVNRASMTGTTSFQIRGGRLQGS